MPQVLIVGAGPAGASLALLLAQRGIHVTLLERQRDFAREFRGEILTPTGLEALEQMGVGGPLGRVPSHELGRIDAYMNGRRFVSVEPSREAFQGHPPRAVSQPGLLEMLVEEAGRSPSFALRRGASVRSLLHDGDRVAGVRASTEDGDQELRADLVIGADGRASAVRKHCGLGVSRSDPPMDIVWCKLPCPEDWPGARAYLGRGHLLVAYRTWDQSLQLGWVILKGTFGELRHRGIEQWIEEMAHHVSADLAAHLRGHADAVQKPFLLDTASDCVERWSRPGALVIGDAAHTMSPVGGQGINIALRDAIVAANHLVPVLTEDTLDASHLEAACAAIQEERMREVAPLQRLQAQPPKVVLSHAWWGEPLRRVLGALLARPFAQRRLVGQVGAFAFGLTEVKLRV